MLALSPAGNHEPAPRSTPRQPWYPLSHRRRNTALPGNLSASPPAMYQALTDFLTTFNVQWPLLWAVLVTLVVAGTGLLLYAFWELTLGGLVKLFTRLRRSTDSRS